ncbi:MAG: DUF4143 domain-containing protein [Candidatus Sumerlaeota bacterium]|nr:DUF4143 domain-containing protein [Candidatus Sumerlaeota bacterium]
MESVIRFFKPPKGSFFLFGPRGTGKSTWARQACPDALWIDLLEPDVFRRYSARPERLREAVEAAPRAKTIVIDEIQKAPALLDAVHALIEERPARRFILTGSSVRKLKRAGVDLWAGRAVARSLHPFMAAELGAAFSLEKALAQGMIPLVWGARDPLDTLKSYAALYVREEVMMEGLTRNAGDFSRFLEAVSFSHGGVLNAASVARECEVQRKTVENYLGILEDLLLAFRLPVFTRRAVRAVAAHPKFYLCDAGLFRSLRPSGPLDRPSEIEGQALEGLVAQHLRAWIAYNGERSKLYYWRSRAGSEVDFVVYGPDGFWAIEVKNTARIRPDDLRSLQAFKEDYPECKTILLYRGKERLKIDDCAYIPCEQFMLSLKPGHSIL